LRSHSHIAHEAETTVGVGLFIEKCHQPCLSGARKQSCHFVPEQPSTSNFIVKLFLSQEVCPLLVEALLVSCWQVVPQHEGEIEGVFSWRPNATIRPCHELEKSKTRERRDEHRLGSRQFDLDRMSQDLLEGEHVHYSFTLGRPGDHPVFVLDSTKGQEIDVKASPKANPLYHPRHL
jgi:hypothetical protein